MKKICYAVVLSARKLRHFFEAHRVRVLTNQPLNDIFGNQDCSGRIGKWAMELSEHVVDFEKRNTIKSQVSADFIAHWIEPSSYTEGTVMDTSWQVSCDRVWGISEARAAAILTSPSDIKLRYAARLQFTIEID
jgi:ribonuclease HI